MFRLMHVGSRSTKSGTRGPSSRRSRPRSSGRSRRRWDRLLRSAAETERLGFEFGHASRGGEVIALYGDLGTGKTTFVRGLAAGMGVPPRRVGSPTFVLVREYCGRSPLAHADLYRLDSERELPDLGLTDYFNGRTVVAIEWAEKGAGQLPSDRLDVHLTHRSLSVRGARLSAGGPVAREWLSRTLSNRRGRPSAQKGKAKGAGKKGRSPR